MPANSKTLKPFKTRIKEAVKKALQRETAAKEIHIARTVPTRVSEEAETAFLIYTADEDVEMFDTPKRYKRTLQLTIKAITVADTDEALDARMESLGETIERAMERDDSLGGLIDRAYLSGITPITDGEAEQPVGNLSINYDLVFYKYAQDPEDGALDDFLGANVTYEVGHDNEAADGVVDAEDKINVTS